MQTQSYNNDAYRSHQPFSFVILGGEFCYVKKYDLTLTNRGEASNAGIEISLDAIDSKIFKNEENTDNYIECEIYSGYLTDTEDPDEQIDSMLNLIKLNQTDRQSKFVNRLEGFVGQPEWTFGDERTLKLQCYDWSQVLREYEWARNLKDGETEVREAIKLVQADLKGIKIVADVYAGSLKLGEQDPQTKKWTYNASGKKYFQILEDCAQKMGKNVIVKGKNIYITKYKEEPVIWHLYYGSRDSAVFKSNKDGLMPFKTANLRYGKVGEVQKSNVVVELMSRTTSKKGKTSQTKYTFPENANVNALTKKITRVLKNNLSEHELKVLAEQIYNKESKKVMTGNVDFEFANPFLDVYDLVTFVADEEQIDMAYLKDDWFSVNSISESYSVDGYTQKIDFDCANEIKNTPGQRKSPVIPRINNSGHSSRSDGRHHKR